MSDRIALKPNEAAEALGVGVRTLQDWTRDGYIPSIHRGGVRLYSVDALRQWAEQASEYEGADHGKKAMGNGVGLSAPWGRTVGGRGQRTPTALRPDREGGAEVAR